MQKIPDKTSACIIFFCHGDTLPGSKFAFNCTTANSGD